MIARNDVVCATPTVGFTGVAPALRGLRRALDADLSEMQMTGAETRTPSLGDRAARGSSIVLGSQALKAFLQFGSLILLARLLTPSDFGLVAMVTSGDRHRRTCCATSGCPPPPFQSKTLYETTNAPTCSGPTAGSARSARSW